MCGFFGEIAFNRQTDTSDLKAISMMSSHRGPDASDFYQGERVFMSFNRLTVLDTSSEGMQPKKSPSNRYRVVFNGEIYNHQELRRKLTRRFKGTGDTETIVHALDEFGIENTINSLDGMFAIVIWDEQSEELTMVRDFAGIKPLFYGIDGEGIVFASQYDQLAIHPWFTNNPVNPKVFRLYLEQHFVPPPFGIITDTFQVKPGEIVKVNSNGRVSKRNFWEFPEPEKPYISDPRKAIDLLEDELERSVHSEMLSDVPLGTFLSGGIDSPLITYYSKKKDLDLKCFSIGSDSVVHDELDDAIWYANNIGVEHYISRLTSNEVKNNWEDAMCSLHEPIADLSIIPTFAVSKLSRAHVTVALSGDGGDELFFGYERFWSIAKNIHYQSYPHWLKYLLYGFDKVITGNRNLNSVLLASDQGKAHRGLHSRFRVEEINAIFPNLNLPGIPENYNTYSYPLFKDTESLLLQMRKAEFYGMMQKTLRKVDLASMQNSLEVRVPFLKKSFIEAAVSINPSLSFGPNKKKEILKSLLKGYFPKAPIDNRKRGFSVPFADWMKAELKEPIYDVLQSQALRHEYGVDSKQLNQMMNDHAASISNSKWPLFTIFALFQWKLNLNKSKSLKYYDHIS